MIQANELRIGNWVNYHNFNNDGNPRYFKARDIYFEDGKIGLTDGRIQLPCTYLEYIKPIPLTEEILLKCGFEGSKETIFTRNDIGSIYFRKPYLESSLYLIKAVSGDKMTSVTHLHQLQNLYFALTGKELEVKL